MRRKSLHATSALVAFCLMIQFIAVSPAQAANGAIAAELQTASQQTPDYETVVSNGVEFLLSQQAEDGSWSAQIGPAITALATTALIHNGRTLRDPAVAKGLAYLESHVQPDGGIYKPGSRLQTYETCASLMCFAAANENGKYDQVIADAAKHTRGLQVGVEDGDESDFSYGGAGYGPGSRPDLSNTHFFVEALRASGADENDAAIQNALKFVSRCQNLESEHNTTPFSAKVNDGGSYYTPSAGGGSAADETPNGGLRSYASMTYAGLKSMIFAGVDEDDQRVQAAKTWIQKHYSLEENPGMGAAGLYYYYQLFSKTLSALGEDSFEAADGETHNWKTDLLVELASRQQENGGWVNQESDRWMEGSPTLATCFALLALADCKPAE